MGALLIYHVHFTCADDYMARRLPFRPAHLAQLAALRAEGRVVAGGPEPDGRAANIVYRVADRAELDRLLDDNVFQRAGLFAARHPRSFVEFLEPIEVVPVDAGLKVTIVEGTPADPHHALQTLAKLRADGTVAFAGVFEDGSTLAVVRSADTARAVEWLAQTGAWTAAALRARPWSQTL